MNEHLRLKAEELFKQNIITLLHEESILDYIHDDGGKLTLDLTLTDSISANDLYGFGEQNNGIKIGSTGQIKEK